MVSWTSFLPLFLLIALIIYENKVTVPTCEILPNHSKFSPLPTDVNIMLVADLLLKGSETSYINLFFRDPYMAKFFKKSLVKLNPDMLVVLGDISANGRESTNKQWLSVLHQFQDMMGPYSGIPVHIVVGDKDVGGCHEMDRLVDRAVNSLPGLESAACGSFSVNNISFVSLNVVAMACDQDDLRLDVERVIERESAELQQERNSDALANDIEIQEEEAGSVGTWEEHCEASSSEETAHCKQQFCWKQNGALSGSGPVVLLHHPLYRPNDEVCGNIDIPKCSAWNKLSHNCNKSWASTDMEVLKNQEYEEMGSVLSCNATEYILHALKPRMVFSAHMHWFCDRTHEDGTREITVPTMSWNSRDDPGFVVATFCKRNDAVMIQRCFLAKESHVLMAYVLVLILLLVITIMSFWLYAPSVSYGVRTLE